MHWFGHAPLELHFALNESELTAYMTGDTRENNAILMFTALRYNNLYISSVFVILNYWHDVAIAVFINHNNMN